VVNGVIQIASTAGSLSGRVSRNGYMGANTGVASDNRAATNFELAFHLGDLVPADEFPVISAAELGALTWNAGTAWASGLRSDDQATKRGKGLLAAQDVRDGHRAYVEAVEGDATDAAWRCFDLVDTRGPAAVSRPKT